MWVPDLIRRLFGTPEFSAKVQVKSAAVLRPGPKGRAAV
jgi:hypothetical protein